MDQTTEHEVREFVSHPIPPGGTPEFDEWKRQAESFGSKSVNLFLDVISTGNGEQQYVAAIALRQLGVEVWKNIEKSPPVWQVRQGAEDTWVEYPCRP